MPPPHSSSARPPAEAPPGVREVRAAVAAAMARVQKLKARKLRTEAGRLGVPKSKSDAEARVLLAREVARRCVPPGFVVPDDVIDPKAPPPPEPAIADDTNAALLGSVASVQDLTGVLYGQLAPRTKVLLVNYKLAHCRACSALQPKLKRVVEKFHDETGGAVQLLTVDCSHARGWTSFEPFSIPGYPWFHIFTPNEGFVDAFSANLQTIGRVRDAVAAELARERAELACPFPKPATMPVVVPVYAQDDDALA